MSEKIRYNFVSTLASSFLIKSFLILAGKEDNHKIWDEFEFQLDLTMNCGVSCPSAFEKKTYRLIIWKSCSHSSTVIFDWIFFIVAGNEDNYESLEMFEFCRNSTTYYGVSCLESLENDL